MRLTLSEGVEREWNTFTISLKDTQNSWATNSRQRKKEIEIVECFNR